MLTHIGVRNLRSYGKNEQLIDLKKINLFIGRNSSGKSTFLRVLPLLRQSLEAETLSPILWFGKFVDFGDINTVKNDSFKKEGVTFDFKTNILLKDLKKYFKTSIDFFELKEQPNIELLCKNIINELPKNINIKTSLTIYSEQEYQIAISLEEFNYQLTYKVLDRQVKLFQINYNDFMQDFTSDIGFVRGRDSLFSDIFYSRHPIKRTDQIGNRYRRMSLDVFFWNTLKTTILSPYKKVPEDIESKFTKLCFNSDESTLIKLFNNNSKIKNLIYKEKDTIKKIHISIFGMLSGYLLKINNHEISDYFKSIRYIGPVRANSDRYYRYQGIQVNELDHIGHNLPMVIQSLKLSDRDALSLWIKENLGFQIKLVLNDQHYAIQIMAEEDTNFHNITDMGFGYSQILPIAVTIWFETINYRSSSYAYLMRRRFKSVFAIEQPELHLHPAMQYDFGVMVSKLIGLTEDIDISFVLETHSKAIIDAISDEVYSKKLKNDDVSINLFNKNSRSLTEITKANFDNNGYLINWPAGFLSTGDK